MSTNNHHLCATGSCAQDRLRFRRFAHKAYAAFVSLHREVTIGHVCAHIADMELLKSGKRVAVVTMLMTASALSYASPTEGDPSNDTLALQPQHLSLQEVQVVAHQAEVHSQSYRLVSEISRATIASMGSPSLPDILQYMPGVDIRARGAGNSQADVSMRGGTFDQVLVLLNGVPMSDAHTGHYSLNLPVPVETIERIEVLQGTQPDRYGAFAGAINIVTCDNVKIENGELKIENGELKIENGELKIGNKGSVSLKAGMNGLVNPVLTGRWQRGDWQVIASAEYARQDGYYAPDANEKETVALRNSDYQLLNIYNAYAYAPAHGRSKAMVQIGGQMKDAGLGMGYGFGSQDQLDATRTLFGSADYSHHWGRWSLRAQASYRANYDRYEWHRGQRLYGNFHLSQTASASLQGRVATRIGSIKVGIEVRNENIHSTNLGDTLHADGQRPNVDGFDLKDLKLLQLVRGSNRLNINYSAEQTFHYEGLSASLGASGNYNTMFGHNYMLGANIGYEFAPESRVYANANRSFRLPTFTDLWYDAGSQLGDRNLRPETAWTVALGTVWTHHFDKPASTLTLSADAYYRLGKDIIDWVYVADDTRRPYHATNQQQVQSAGVEASVRYSYGEWLPGLSVSYAYAWLDLDLKEAGSRYLDYLSHKLVAQVDHSIYVWHGKQMRLGACWTVRYQKREGQFNDAYGEVKDYKPVCLLDGSVYWDSRVVRVSVDCQNMTNRHYYDYGGILQPGAFATMKIVAKL